MERHHIIYRSQKGLDFELNFKYLSSEDHRGNHGPHENWKTDLFYKIKLQQRLEKKLTREYYSVKDLTLILGLKKKQANRAFRKLEKVEGVSREDAIRRLMGNILYCWEELNTDKEIMEYIKKNYENGKLKRGARI